VTLVPRTVSAVITAQLLLSLRTPDTVRVLVIAPLYTTSFLAITEHAGRSDLAGYAVLAPTLMSLWSTAVSGASDLIAGERERGTLEVLLSTPVDYTGLILVRLTATTALGALALVETWLVAALGFGVVVPIAHPLWAALVVICTMFAMVGTATCLSALFLLSPSTRILENSLSFPFFLLGGVLVPVDLLPVWLRPSSRLIFLSWSADGLRSCLAPGATQGLVLDVTVVLGLGALAVAVGVLLVRRILHVTRAAGTLGRV
jgi:ABC-2 type transport system permease protein